MNSTFNAPNDLAAEYQEDNQETLIGEALWRLNGSSKNESNSSGIQAYSYYLDSEEGIELLLRDLQRLTLALKDDELSLNIAPLNFSLTLVRLRNALDHSYSNDSRYTYAWTDALRATEDILS